MKINGETLSEALAAHSANSPASPPIPEPSSPPPIDDKDAKRKREILKEMTMDERRTAAAMRSETSSELISIDEFPAYKPEDDDPNIIIKGRWLERGGSAWWISTAGTGKSIASIQFAFCMAAGISFCGFTPNVVNGKPLRFWVIQSEDSPTRISIDRDDVTAELAEQYPEIDWTKIRRKINFLKMNGKVGADFLTELDHTLTIAAKHNQLPDVIIINPFLAYIGGPVTDGAYVTPFLRGGVINRGETKGLQYLLEKYNIAALIFHHTPKPPNSKEVDDWVKSPFPEYQGAGSSDITNWGRSFVTMMRLKDHKNIVMLTAGKNGGELGWEVIDGATRRFMAYSAAKGVTGKNRHAWRELDDEEYRAVTKISNDNKTKDIEAIAAALREKPMTANQAKEHFSKSMKQRQFRSAWDEFSHDHDHHGIACVKATKGRVSCWFFGVFEAAKKAADEWADVGEF